jgi:regulator of replication initiation timing
MNTLAAQHINHFRTAQELSSTQPSQLRRTIAELEARIEEQDAIIALQNEGIQNLASKLAEREDHILILENVRSKPDQGLYDIPDDLRYRAEKENLERANRNMEALIEDFEDGFWTLFAEQRQGLEECLKALEQLPAAPETTGVLSLPALSLAVHWMNRFAWNSEGNWALDIQGPQPAASEEVRACTVSELFPGAELVNEMVDAAGAVPRSTGTERSSPSGQKPARAAHILQRVPLLAEYHIIPPGEKMTEGFVAPALSNVPAVPLTSTGPGNALQVSPLADVA